MSKYIELRETKTCVSSYYRIKIDNDSNANADVVGWFFIQIPYDV